MWDSLWALQKRMGDGFGEGMWHVHFRYAHMGLSFRWLTDGYGRTCCFKTGSLYSGFKFGSELHCVCCWTKR